MGVFLAAVLPQLLAAGGMIAQGAQNKKARQFTEHMYNRQRADALADWNMTNEFNSPLSQMNRLKAGGLNPNLVYDNGAKYEAGAVRSSQAGNWKPQPLPFNETAGMMQNTLANFQQTAVQDAQIDLLKQQSLKTAVETQSIGTKNEIDQFNLGMGRTLADNTKAVAEENLANLQASTAGILSRTETENLMRQPNADKLTEEIQNLVATRGKLGKEQDMLDQQINNARKDGKLKDLDIALKEIGIQPGDNMIFRFLAQAINNPGGFYNFLENLLQKVEKLRQKGAKIWTDEINK